MLSHRAPFWGAPPLGPQHPPKVMLGRCMASPCCWCMNTDTFGGLHRDPQDVPQMCAGTLPMLTSSTAALAPPQPPNEDTASLMSTAGTMCGSSCSRVWVTRRCSWDTGHPWITLLVALQHKQLSRGCRQLPPAALPHSCAGLAFPSCQAQLPCPVLKAGRKRLVRGEQSQGAWQLRANHRGKEQFQC